MAKQERKSFILYHSYETQFGLLSMEERGELITAIFSYDRTGEIPEGLSAVVAMALSFIRDALDRDRGEYEAMCHRQTENGKKGGRPRKESVSEEPTEKTHCFSEKPKKAYNDNDNENDNDNDNGEEKKKEKETTGLGRSPLFSGFFPPSAAPPKKREIFQKHS